MSLKRRVSEMEEHIEAEVERRLEEEIESALDELERGLSREEFVKAAKILAAADAGECEGGDSR